MLKQYVKRGIYTTMCYAISSLFVRSIGFLFLPYLLATLSLTDFGIWDYYQTVFLIGSMVIASCTSIPMVRFFVLHKHDPEQQQETLGTSLILVIISALLFLTAAGGVFVAHCQGYGSEYPFLALCNVGFFIFFAAMTDYLRAREQLWWYLFAYCGQSFLALILMLIGVKYGFGAASFFYANCVSYLLFIPGIIALLRQYPKISYVTALRHIKYGSPILIYNILYAFFFVLDRLFIKYYAGGYEMLGEYALLWRFGRIFQYFGIAMLDAIPLVLFNAQADQHGPVIIPKMLRYVIIVLLTICLVLVLFSCCAVHLLFPLHYRGILKYIPLFFAPLALLEMGRLLQVGFALSTNTRLIPFISLITLGLQAVGLYWWQYTGLWGIFLANTGAFACYAAISAFGSLKVSAFPLFDQRRMLMLAVLFLIYIGLLHIAGIYQWPLCISFVLLATWPMSLWLLDIFDAQEKAIVITLFKTVYSYKSVL